MSRPDALYQRTGLCAECDRPYDKKRADQRFCGKACAAAWYAAHPHPKKKAAGETPAARREPTVGIVHDLIGDQYDVATSERNGHPRPITCEQCGKAYDRKRAGQRFCGPGCAGAWSSTHPKQEHPAPPPDPLSAALPDPQPALEVAPEPPTEPAVQLEVPAADLQVVLARLALQAIGAADAWHLEAWCGPGIHLTLRKEAT